MRPSVSLPQDTQAVKTDLLCEVVRRFGQARFCVQGSSMLPLLFPGDVVTVVATDVQHLRPGQLVLFFRRGRLFLHRVLRTVTTGDDVCVHTQGDRLTRPDPPVAAAEVLGRVTSVVRRGRRVAPGERLPSSARLLRLLSRWSDLPAGLLIGCQARFARLRGD